MTACMKTWCAASFTPSRATFYPRRIMRSFREISNMGHFDPEKPCRTFSPTWKTAPSTWCTTWLPKASDQVELSFGWGQTGVVGRVGLRFSNFSMQNLFGKGRKRAGFIPQAMARPSPSAARPTVRTTRPTRSRSSIPGSEGKSPTSSPPPSPTPNKRA